MPLKHSLLSNEHAPWALTARELPLFLLSDSQAPGPREVEARQTPAAHEAGARRWQSTRWKPRGVRGVAKAGPRVSPLLSLTSLHKRRETTDLPRK